MKAISLAVLVIIALNQHLVSAVAPYLPKLVDKIELRYPAFGRFIPSPLDQQYHLAVSSFNGMPFSSDYVTYYSNFTLNSPSRTVRVLNNKNLHWPNEATFTNESIINSTVDPFGGLIVAAGFLVPTKTNGGIFYYPFLSADRSTPTSNEPIELSYSSNKQHDWFYHRVSLIDINGDGKTRDLITCRSNKPIFGQTTTQLVAYLLNPQSQLFEEQVIMNGGCDIFYDIGDLDNDGRFEIITAGFFISQVNIIYTDNIQNNFLGGNAKLITIDSKAGQLFDVQLDDLDGDNKLEILATNHQGNKDQVKGALFYYKMQGSNFKNSTWERFMIYENFPVLKAGINQAAPGAAILFQPNLNDKSGQKYIILAGDGSEYAYLFQPNMQPDGSLNYTLVWTQLYKNTVGGISVADLNGDGYNECVIPIYESNTLFFYTFAP